VSDHIRIVEVGPRDGLQNERSTVPVEARVQLIDALVAAGIRTVEAGSFVAPKSVPQMSGSDEVLRRIKRPVGVSFPVLVPNLKGLQGALAANADTVGVFAAASERFSRKNLNCSISESLQRFGDVAAGATERGLRVRGYVSCAIHCPYEGFVAPGEVVPIAEALLAMGCFEVALCDTTGAGTPAHAKQMLQAAICALPAQHLAVHFHDTYGQALANTLIALEMGIKTIDSSVSGLGGCPFSPGSAGNLATEDLLYMLHGLGLKTGVDLEAVAAAGRALMGLLARATTSRVAAALAARGRSRAN
jgi:hydroxymethylglutaryl-CoA lyase